MEKQATIANIKARISEAKRALEELEAQLTYLESIHEDHENDISPIYNLRKIH
jgi:archaellum component FlaC